MPVLTEEFTTNLVSTAVDKEIVYPYDVVVTGVEFSATVGITEEVKIIHKTATGKEYTRDTKQFSDNQDYAFFPIGKLIIKRGDSLKITVTNANTTGSIDILASVQSLQP